MGLPKGKVFAKPAVEGTNVPKSPGVYVDPKGETFDCSDSRVRAWLQRKINQGDLVTAAQPKPAAKSVKKGDS